MDLQTETSQQYLERILRTHLSRPARTPDGKFHFSSLSDARECKRKRIMKMAGFQERPKKLGSLITLRHGDELEKVVLAAEAKHGDGLCVTQGQVELPEFNAKGTFDLMKLRSGGRVKMVDVKTASEKKWDKGFVHRFPNTAYRMQLTGYCMGVLKEEWAREIEGAEIWHISKGGHGVFVEKFEWRMYVGAVEEDFRRWASDWEEYQRSQCLPLEVGFSKCSKTNKHFVSGRAKEGDLVPGGLCSPEYCELLDNCSSIRKWWDDHPLEGKK